MTEFLTDRAKAYLAHYAKHRSHQKAAEFLTDGESSKQPHWYKKDSLLQEEIRKIDNEDLKKEEIDSNWVLKKAVTLASFNIHKFIELIDGVPHYNFSKADEDDWYCLAEMNINPMFVYEDKQPIRVDSVKLKSVDKLKALKICGEHVNIAAFKTDVTLAGDTKIIFEHNFDG